MLGQREMTMEDVTGILRRRWFYLVVPLVVGPLIAMGIALLLPAKYTSASLIMIEQQRVPDSVVKSVVSENLIARLATLQQQVLSRNTLQPIIEKYGLYKSEVARGVSMDDLLSELRDNLTVKPVPSILESAPGSKVVMTSKEDIIPGFYITFTTDDPKRAQEVCADLTGQFIQQNYVSRSKMAHETTAFVDTELVDAKRKLDEQDARLSEFQKKYSGALPDEERNNLSLLSAVTAQLQAVTQSLGRAEQDKTYTESLLAQQLSAWDSVKSRGSSHVENTDKEIASLEDRLAAMEARYTPNHPDVVKLKAAIEQLKKSRATSPSAAPDASAQNKAEPVSPFEPKEIQQLRSSLRGLEEAVGVYKQEQVRMAQEAKSLESRLQMSPVVETQYKQLTRDSKTAQDFYNDLLTKKNNSGMATNLESTQEGEQFRILDSATLPDQPSFPVYWMFAAGGAGGGLALGLVIVLLLEMRDKAIRTERDIEFFLELPTLVLLPSVGLTRKQKNGRFRRWWRKRRKPVVKHPAGQPAQA